jgi:beta-mannanase
MKTITHKKLLSHRQITAVSIVLVVALIGTYLLIASHASTPESSLDVDKGALAGDATVQTSTTADDGHYVQFGNTPSSSSGTTLIQGLFDSSQNPNNVISDASQIGTKVTAMTAYTDGSSWSSIAGYQPPSTSLRLLLGVNMNPSNSNPTQTPSNLSTFKTLAQTLVSSGHDNAILRIGWEWSGNWFAWSNNGYQAYVTAFDDIVTTMRSVNGQQFSFDWCSNAGSTPTQGTYADWYPGNNYVDYIGADFYQTANDQSAAQTTSEWNSSINETGGLAYTASFAVAHNKLMSIPEWGVNGNNSATFVNLMSSFVHNPANKVGYEAYFNDTGPNANDVLQDLPVAEAAFKADFPAN